MSSPLKFSDFLSFGFLLSLANKPPNYFKNGLTYIISLSFKSWHSFRLWFSSFAHKQNPEILQAWHSKNVYNLFGPQMKHFFRAFRRWLSGAVSLSCNVNWRWRTRSGCESTVGTLWNKPRWIHYDQTDSSSTHKWNQESDFRSGSLKNSNSGSLKNFQFQFFKKNFQFRFFKKISNSGYENQT
jgi:hypothetical protein